MSWYDVSMTKLVVFDFDGTIADSFDEAMVVFKKLVPGQDKLTQEQIDILRNKPYKDIFDYFKISYFRVPGLVVKGRQMLKRSIHKVNPYDGIAASLRQLKADGYALAIISSNATQSIEKFLDKHNLTQYFDSVEGYAGLRGKPKLIRALMKKRQAESNQTIYVGDEPRDIEAAKKAGVWSIAVTWGFGGATILAAHEPTLMIDRTSELAGAVNEILS
jgi:phosphoglycolate phosphatase